MAALDDEAAADPHSAPSRLAGGIAAPTHDEIAALAYSYWQARGGHGGSPSDDWLRAEEELVKRRKR